MDDLYDYCSSPDLIYDALWEECHTEEELPDDIIDSIIFAAINDGIDDHTDICDALDSDATFDDVCFMLARFEAYAMAENRSMYLRLRDIVAAHYEYLKGERA